jgi:phospholipase C
MKRLFERSYSKVIKNVFRITNPIKKQIIKTECKVHKFINIQALVILKNDGHSKAFNYYSNYIKDINAGAVWADQDYKSTNHFYNPDYDKGLFGFSNAHKECVRYYAQALTKYFEWDEKGAMFYLGAACHLLQDVTIPQHVNIKLLKHHRKYEQWVIKAYEHHTEFKAFEGGIYLRAIKDYMDYNSNIALKTYEKYLAEENLETKFYKTTLVILITAQKTTAGLLLNFYNDVERLKANINIMTINKINANQKS